MSRVLVHTNRVLTPTKKTQIIVPNGGGIGATDWVDSNEDGLADNWSSIGTPAHSIVINNGFIGNAQRVERLLDNAFIYGGLTVQQGIHKLSFKYRSNGNFQIYYFGVPIILPENVGDAVYFEEIRTMISLANIRFYTIDELSWFEIDELNVISYNERRIIAH